LRVRARDFGDADAEQLLAGVAAELAADPRAGASRSDAELPIVS
jgi:hypothetical protein